MNPIFQKNLIEHIPQRLCMQSEMADGQARPNGSSMELALVSCFEVERLDRSLEKVHQELDGIQMGRDRQDGDAKREAARQPRG